MKITDRFTGDHKTFKKLYKDLDEIARLPLAQQDQKRLIRLTELFVDHMLLHSWGEERIYYPALADAAKRRSEALSEAAVTLLPEEHRIVDVLITQLETDVKAQPLTDTWTHTLAAFWKALKFHMDKEDNELFPLSEKLLGADRLHQLSDELERHRSEAPRIRIHSQF